MSRFKDQVALVTGGARGIGKAVVEAFCKEGAVVAFWDVLEEGKELANSLTEQGHQAIFQHVDVTKREEVAQAVAKVMEQFGKIDILINNAGIIRDKSFLKMSDQEWQSVLDVNLNGVFNVTKEVVPHMKAASYGRVASASSINAIMGAFGQTNYCSTKAAIIGFTKALAREVGKDGITVNAVAPGFIQTDMTASMPEEVIAAGIQQIPVRRVGLPEDIANAYLFLSAKESGFINGEVLNVNGGVIS